MATAQANSWTTPAVLTDACAATSPNVNTRNSLPLQRVLTVVGRCGGGACAPDVLVLGAGGRLGFYSWGGREAMWGRLACLCFQWSTRRLPSRAGRKGTHGHAQVRLVTLLHTWQSRGISKEGLHEVGPGVVTRAGHCNIGAHDLACCAGASNDPA